METLILKMHVSRDDGLVKTDKNKNDLLDQKIQNCESYQRFKM